MLGPANDLVECYEVVDSNVVSTSRSGDSVPERERPALDVPDRLPRCSIERPGESDVYLRVSGDSPVQVAMEARDLSSHRSTVVRDLVAQAAYFGVLVAMFVYNAFIFAATRRVTYLAYCSFVATFGLLQGALTGLTPFWFPKLGGGAINMIAGESVLGAVAAGMIFAFVFLDGGFRGTSKVERFGKGLLAVVLAMLVALPIASYHRVRTILPPFIVLGAGWTIVEGIRNSILGRRTAKFFLGAWSWAMAGTVLNALRVAGHVPTNAFTMYAIQIGSVIEMVLLSFALADRMKQLEAEATHHAKAAAESAEGARLATERELAQQARTNEELKRLDRIKDEFLANTSHELRTPLHGMLGLTESVLLSSTKLDLGSRERLGMVLASGRRLASLVNDILDFSKLRHQAIVLREKNVDLREAVMLALSVVMPIAGSKGITLRSEVAAESIVRADENRLQQVLTNLLGNAVKFTLQGEVVVRAENREGRIHVSVQDTGIGIPKDAQARIFESFEQADGSTSREFGGTGLGLAVTKQLVELHGGLVAVDSEPGRGSTFTFDLPRADRTEHDTREVDAPIERGSVLLRTAPHAMLASEQIAPATLVVEADTRGHLLVADDDPVNVEVLRAQLEPAGYTVSAARDGAEAVELLARLGEQVDGVLLDVMMPKMTGLEAAARMREAHPHGTLPILMLTAKSRQEDVIVGMRAGASDYIGKPFHREELLHRVDAQLQSLKTARAFRRFVPENFLGLLGVERFDALRAGIGQRHDVTILFTDVRGFTARSERLGPEGTFRFINAYLEHFEPVVRAHGGFVDKFIGDAVMAIFPGEPLAAAHAAEALQREVGRFNAADPALDPLLAIGVGAHRGPVILGTVGNADRLEVTAIGDAVNVAARLESLTKSLGAGAIVSEEVVGRGWEGARRVGALRVKGRAEPVEVFELLGCCASPDERTQKEATADRFQRGLRAYAQGDMARAKEHFAITVHEAPLDRVASLYVARCTHYLETGVPADFDGCFDERRSAD